MKTLITTSALLIVLSSFIMGGHSFVISMDDKQITEQYVTDKVQIPRIVIEAADSRQALIVKYNECGRTVSGRKITAKDNDNLVIREWKFDGSASSLKDPMKVSVKELISLRQQTSGAVKLFYSSNEFPQGQQVADIVISSPTARK